MLDTESEVQIKEVKINSQAEEGHLLPNLVPVLEQKKKKKKKKMRKGIFQSWAVRSAVIV